MVTLFAVCWTVIIVFSAVISWMVFRVKFYRPENGYRKTLKVFGWLYLVEEVTLGYYDDPRTATRWRKLFRNVVAANFIATAVDFFCWQHGGLHKRWDLFYLRHSTYGVGKFIVSMVCAIKLYRMGYFFYPNTHQRMGWGFMTFNFEDKDNLDGEGYRRVLDIDFNTDKFSNVHGGLRDEVLHRWDAPSE